MMNAIAETLMYLVPCGLALLFISKGIAKKMDEKGMWD